MHSMLFRKNVLNLYCFPLDNRIFGVYIACIIMQKEVIPNE